MKVVMPQLKGVADGNLVRQIVTEELASVTLRGRAPGSNAA